MRWTIDIILQVLILCYKSFSCQGFSCPKDKISATSFFVKFYNRNWVTNKSFELSDELAKSVPSLLRNNWTVLPQQQFTIVSWKWQCGNNHIYSNHRSYWFTAPNPLVVVVFASLRPGLPNQFCLGLVWGWDVWRGDSAV